MKLTGALLCSVLLAHPALADDTSFDYLLGATKVTEDRQQIVIHAEQPLAIAILPGGKTWPVLALGESGNIHAGGAVIDAATGRLLSQTLATLALPHGVDVTALADGYRFRRGARNCQLSLRQLHLGHAKTPLDSLKDRNLMLASGGKVLLALVTQFDREGNVGNYLVERIDIDRCTVTAGHKLGNPDLLVELGQTAGGGWWLTGSIEQTLLRSNDGRHWRAISLPAGLSSLVSSHVVDAREIWLAGVLGGEADSLYLVYSGDGGRHWRNLQAGDPLLQRMPAGWLEGQKRRVIR